MKRASVEEMRRATKKQRADADYVMEETPISRTKKWAATEEDKPRDVAPKRRSADAGHADEAMEEVFTSRTKKWAATEEAYKTRDVAPKHRSGRWADAGYADEAMEEVFTRSRTKKWAATEEAYKTRDIAPKRRSGRWADAGYADEAMEEVFTWAEMAPDVLTNIFVRLPFKQRLLDIPSVCKPWKLASQDPLCWQKLDLEFCKKETSYILEPLLQRCQGCLQELTLPLIHDRYSLDLLACSAPLLEKLDIPNSCADDEWATYAAPLMPRITDLNLSFSTGKLSHLALEAFGRSCRGITKLRRRRYECVDNHTIDDSEAFAISRHYPLLRHLELELNPLSTQGLRAILENCPALEYLDVGDCPNLKNMDATLLNLCRSRLKVFVEPNAYDSSDDDDSDNAYDSSDDAYDSFDDAYDSSDDDDDSDYYYSLILGMKR